MMPNSLSSSKTPAIIVNEIKMLNTTFKGVHFLVEGEADVQFWKIRVSKNSVSIIDCQGKLKLLGATQLLLQQKINRFVGVYDADFDRLHNIVHHPEKLTPTDHNDLETTLLASPALDMLLHEHANEALLQHFQKTQGLSVLQHIQKLASEFGKLRFLSQQCKHQVNFNELNPYQFVDKAMWSLNLVNLHKVYAEKAQIQQGNIQPLIQQHLPNPIEWGLCQGHDAMCILAQGLKQAIGKTHKSETEWLKILRGAYDNSYLQNTLMYKNLKNLENDLKTPVF